MSEKAEETQSPDQTEDPGRAHAPGQTRDTGVRSTVMEEADAIAGEAPTPQLRSIVCPYCGSVTPDTGRCASCAGRYDPLSRQATQNQMGPWVIRDDRVPFRPGCTYDTLVRLIDQGKVTTETVLRGPSTHQFWMLARHTPGVAQRLGVCHNCQIPVKPDAFACRACHAPFTIERDRQHLGLGPARPLPGQGMPQVLALRAEPASVRGGGTIASASVGGPDVVGQASSETPKADPQSFKKVDEANRLARDWRTQALSSRRHAWVLIICFGLVTLISLVYALTQ